MDNEIQTMIATFALTAKFAQHMNPSELAEGIQALEELLEIGSDEDLGHELNQLRAAAEAALVECRAALAKRIN